jgi:hypothetical protein
MAVPTGKSPEGLDSGLTGERTSDEKKMKPVRRKRRILEHLLFGSNLLDIHPMSIGYATGRFSGESCPGGQEWLFLVQRSLTVVSPSF